uniref:LisH domain-containing protein n=1 Tax=Anopheles minimus TaxID=112268 RepID=A0A182W4Q1_9DIPT
MENNVDEVTARAVLAYLYDNDMYDLAEQFYLRSPYLEEERGSMLDGSLPINYLQKPLQTMFQEYTTMQSQLLQLVNRSNNLVNYPHSYSVQERVDVFLEFVQTCTVQASSASAPSHVVANAHDLEYSVTDELCHSAPLVASVSNNNLAITPGAIEDSAAAETEAPNKLDNTSASNEPRENRTATSTPFSSALRQQIYPTENVPRDNAQAVKVVQQAPLANAENIPPNCALPRANATPHDHPIVSGTASSRSTSSRNKSHIRILDFDTPPQLGSSPNPVIPTPAQVQPQLTSNVNTKPKKLTGQSCMLCKRPMRHGKKVQKKMGKRSVLKRCITSRGSLHTCTVPSNRNETTIKTTTDCAPTINMSPVKALPNAFWPPSTSPSRTDGPDSPPACPIDPLAMCPMTPRFLIRPLQPLFMLSPLLGTLDASAISNVKSNSPTKPTDINTPRYPITPGNAITPSPPPYNVSYYESEQSGDHNDRLVPADEPDYSEPGVASAGTPKPQLTLTASERSTEIAIQYVEREQLPPVAEHDPEFFARLASRIEIDNGNRVFQIAVSPTIALYEDLS